MRASIVAVFFNNEDTVAPCLDSLLELLWPDKELVVVHDTADRDRTREILQGYRDRIQKYVEVHKVTLSQMYNAGIEVATGEIVLVVDGDTLYAPDYLEKTVAAMGDDPQVAGALGRKRVLNPHSFYTRLIDLDYSVRMRQGRYQPWTCWVFRRKPLTEIGGYWPRCGPGDFSDYEIFLRLKDRGYRVVFCEKAEWFEIERKTLAQEFWRHYRRGASMALTEPNPVAKWPIVYQVARSFYIYGLALAAAIALLLPFPWAFFWMAVALVPLGRLLGRYVVWGLQDQALRVVLYPLLGVFYRDPIFALGYVRGRLAGLPPPRPGKM